MVSCCLMFSVTDGFATLLPARSELAQLLDAAETSIKTACLWAPWVLVTEKPMTVMQIRSFITVKFTSFSVHLLLNLSSKNKLICLKPNPFFLF